MTEQGAVLLIGLTGNYGMGKSSVLRIFRDSGAFTIDADEIVSELLAENDVTVKIRKLFGEGIFVGGKLDKASIAAIIFRDISMRRRMEEILHPLVMERIEGNIREIRKRNAQGKIIVVEIPLLFERGYARRFHRTITVSAQQEVVLERLSRAGISRDDVLLRLAAQMPIGEKERLSDHVINNSGSYEVTRAQVENIFGRLKEELSVRYGNCQRT